MFTKQGSKSKIIPEFLKEKSTIKSKKIFFAITRVSDDLFNWQTSKIKGMSGIFGIFM